MRTLVFAAAMSLAVTALFPAWSWAGQCTDPALEEARITEQLDAEPSRPHMVIEGERLERFRQNMKYAFDIDVQADKVYFIKAITHASRPAVHVFTVLNGCITYYVVTDMALMAELVNRDPASWPRSPEPEAPPVVLPPVKVEQTALTGVDHYVLVIDAPGRGVRMFYVYDSYEECADNGRDRALLLRNTFDEAGFVEEIVRWRCLPFNDDGSMPLSPPDLFKASGSA